MYEHIVIAGGGVAAMQAVETLRRKGFKGRLTVVGEEPCLPYQRPPLSKQYLAGRLANDDLLIRPQKFFAEHDIHAHIGRRITEISRREGEVRLDNGLELPYDALVLATGSRPRRLQVPGDDLGGVYYLRTLSDAECIRRECIPGRRMLIVGGGYVGLEVAATARGLGMSVTVLEMAGRVMNRVTSQEVSVFLESEHARQGVRIHCNQTVRALHGDAGAGRVHRVLTEDGGEYPADLVVIGVGVAPADELAKAAGLNCENGVVTDAHCRTSDGAIYAVGDCASHLSHRYGRQLRLESVANAYEQGAHVALNLLGAAAPYNKVPWFWSDQFDLQLVTIGIAHGYDAVVMRGRPAAHSFSVCYLSNGELIAIDTINAAKDQMAARKLIATHLRPNLEKLADPSIALMDTVS